MRKRYSDLEGCTKHEIETQEAQRLNAIEAFDLQAEYTQTKYGDITLLLAEWTDCHGRVWFREVVSETFHNKEGLGTRTKGVYRGDEKASYYQKLN